VLDKKKTTVYDYWQFWRNVEDVDVFKYLKLFTEIPISEIESYEKEKNSSNINYFKILLANTTTTILHGKKESNKAEITSKKTFEEKRFGENLPTKTIKKADVDKGISFNEIIKQIHFASSNSDYRRNIVNRAYRINNEIVDDEKRILSTSDFNIELTTKISFGKKKHFLIKIG